MSPEEQKAFDRGREISREYIAEIDRFISSHYEKIRVGYLGFIQKQLDSCRQQDEHSPILVARAEYALYLNDVKGAQAKLRDEVKHHFSDWTELNRQMNIEDLIEEYLDRILTDRFTDLSLAGLNVMMDNADILKTADDNWRRQFPDRAAAQPLE